MWFKNALNERSNTIVCFTFFILFWREKGQWRENSFICVTFSMHTNIICHNKRRIPYYTSCNSFRKPTIFFHLVIKKGTLNPIFIIILKLINRLFYSISTFLFTITTQFDFADNTYPPITQRYTKQDSLNTPNDVCVASLLFFDVCVTLLRFCASCSVARITLKLGFSRHVGHDIYIFSGVSELDAVQNAGKI